jgi:hypothetical protein
MVGRWILAPVVKVRVLAPQLSDASTSVPEEATLVTSFSKTL